MDFPPGTLPIHGLTTVQLGCDSVATYAIGREQAFSKVYEIDFDTWTVTEVCEVPRSVTGAGAQTECMLPPCDIFVDLDNDNSSFGFWGNYCADTFCVPPVAVADTDVVILSASGHLDSLVLELGLVLDLGQEYLQFAPSGNVGVLGNNSTYLTLTNNGSATIADFEAALKAVQYFNDALPLTFGKRMVNVRAWSGGVESIVSIAELPLSNELLHLQADISPPSCFGLSDGSVQVSTLGGFPPYNYQWGTGQLGSFVASLPAGSYPLTVTDSFGCNKMDTIVLVQPSLLTATIANNGLPAICNDSGELLANAQGGVLPYTFNWDNGAVGSANSGIGPGSYLLTVSDSNGCQATATYTIASGDTVLVSQQEEICEGETFAWGGSLYATDTLLCLTYTLPGGCDSTLCLALSVKPLPQPAIAIDGDFCDSGEVVLSTGLFSTYLWSNGETSQQIAVASAGAFAVTVSNIYGCTATATVTVPAGVEFNIAASPPTCFGDENGSILVENVNGGTPPWAYSINGVDFVTGGSFEGLAAGNYTLLVVDAGGCQTSAEVLLESPLPFFVDAGSDQFIQQGEGIVLNASTNLLSPIVLWQPPDYLLCPDCLTTAAHPLQSTQYQVLVTDENGCTASDEVWVEVGAGGQVYVPNAFTPNGDGTNDHLGVFADASIADILLFQVFDRWGGLVYNGVGAKPNLQESGWDGQSKGKKAAEGVYVYRLELLKVDGTRLQMSGEVSLVR
jgi:gliding motility-associated-like protein